MRRVDQNYARAAAAMLDGVDVTRPLRTRYRTLRVMSQSSGLAATYAYVAAKSGSTKPLERAYRRVRDGIGDRLAASGQLTPDETHDPHAVLTYLGDLPAVEYMAASADVTALLGWLARLADALYVQDATAPEALGDDDGDARA